MVGHIYVLIFTSVSLIHSCGVTHSFDHDSHFISVSIFDLTQDGATPLFASAEKDARATKILIEAGCQLDTQDKVQAGDQSTYHWPVIRFINRILVLCHSVT